MSEDSRYRRSFQPMHRLSEDALSFLTEIDHSDHEALVALEPERHEIVGVARYVRSPKTPGRAEVAVAVVDDWQNRGLASRLLGQLAARAREEDVTHFSALVQADNPSAVRALSSLGPTQRHRGREGVELDIALGPREAAGEDRSTAPRTTASPAPHPRGAATRLLGLARRLYRRATPG